VPHQIRFKLSAEKQFGELPAKAQKQVAAKIDALANNSKPNGCEKLEGCEGLWRIRSGRYRVIYQEPDGEGVIRILKVAHRREAYRRL
jgi:mRNA interferase RelE/StbE